MKRSLIFFILFCLAGCGYGFNTRTPENVKTVRLDVSERWPLAARGMEFELTEAVARELNVKYGIRLSREADAKLDINISGYNAGTASSLLGNIEDATLLVKVDVKITLTGPGEKDEVIFDDRLVHREPYSPSRGDSEDAARKRAINRLAPKIADCLVQW